MSDRVQIPGELEFDKARAPSGEAFALSSAQLGIWFAQKLDPEAPAYNIGEYVEIDGPVVLPLFERACGRSLPKRNAASAVLERAASRGSEAARRGMVAADRGRQRRGGPARCGRNLDEGRSGAAGDPTVGPLFGFAMFKASASGSSGTRAITTSCWTVTACGWSPAASPRSIRRSAPATSAGWRVRSAFGAARGGRHLSRVSFVRRDRRTGTRRLPTRPNPAA